MMNTVLFRREGFTLIEIVTVVVVLAILGTFTFSFIDQVTKSYTMGNTQRMLYQEASYMLERMTRELRDADSVSSSSPDTVLYFHRTHQTLMDASNTIYFYQTGDADRSMNRLAFSWPHITNQRLGVNITAFRITRSYSGTDNERINILLTLANGDQTVTLSTSVSPKNFGTNNFTSRCFNDDYEDVIQ